MLNFNVPQLSVGKNKCEIQQNKAAKSISDI
jgi:hypothetical protein